MMLLSKEPLAALIDKASVVNFVTKLQNVMNGRSAMQINNFFQYYSTPDSKYLLTSYYVDPENAGNTLAQEQHEMNKDQYVNYLKDYLTDRDLIKYYIQFKVDNITIDTKKNQAVVSLSYEESSILTAKDQAQNNMQEYGKTTANCNLLVQVDNIDVLLVGLNCVSQSAKKPVKDIQRNYK